MDKKRLDYYRKKLEAKHEELHHMMALAEQEGRAADDATQDIADRAANSYTKEFLFSQSNHERDILALVDEAMERLKGPEFGVCLNCQKDVQQKRLDAVPWTRHCIECQEKQEKGLL